jgi:hypothetical protein
MKSIRPSQSRASVSNVSGTTRLGTLKLGKSYDYSGSLGNGETDIYRFRVGANSGNNALTVDTKVNGSLAAIALLDRQGNVPTGTALSTRVSTSGGGGRISTTFSGITPGAYSLRLQGAGDGANTYSVRLNYQPATESRSSIDFSDLSDRFNIDFSRLNSQFTSMMSSS